MMVSVRRGAVAVVGLWLACSVDRPPAADDVPVPEDPRFTCMREHAGDPAYAAVVRALCAELHDLRGVSASVAIARDDRVVFSVAVGPRCNGRPEPLRPDTPMMIGSITKLVTAALALVVAEQKGVGLDDPLAEAFPELTPSVTLRQLLTHTSGLRDPPAGETILWERAGVWPPSLSAQRGAMDEHAYANFNYLLVGRWLERITGRSYAQLLAQEPALAPARTLVSLMRARDSRTDEPLDVEIPEHVAKADAAKPRSACTGNERPSSAVDADPQSHAYLLPSGGGLASAEDLARLPFALERTGVLTRMLETRVPSDQPGWDSGLAVRMQGEGEGLVLAHAGNNGLHWAELQWSPHERVAVAVVSSTPLAFKATLHAAFTAARTAAEAR